MRRLLKAMSKESFWVVLEIRPFHCLCQIVLITKPASRITELIKIHGIERHSGGQGCGNTPAIQNQHYLQIMLEDHARVAASNTGPKTPNLDQTQVVQDSLIGQVIATTSIEEMAKNTLILQHFGSLIESKKKASSLLKALLAESLQVAGAGFEPTTSRL